MSFRRTPHSSTNATKLSSLLHQSIQNPKPISQITPKPQLPTNISNPNTIIHYFNYLILLQPIPPISKFNQLLASVSNTHLAIVLYRQLNNTHLPISPNLITFNIILDCYCNVNEIGLGFGVLGVILKKGFVANCVTYTSLIKGLVRVKGFNSNNNDNNNNNILEAIRVFKKMVFLGVRPHGVTYGTLINGLCRAGKVDVAVRFHEDVMRGDVGLVCKANVVCYSMLIESLCETGRVSKAKELFHEMRVRRISPDGVSFSSLVRGLAFRDLDEARCLFFEMVDEGVRPSGNVFNLLVNLLCRDGRLNEASGLFELMGRKGVKVEALSYNTLMHAYCLEGKIDEAKELYVSMVDNGIEPDVQVHNVLINGYVKIRRVEEALWIFKQMIRENIKPNVVTYNALLTGLLQKGDVLGAQKFFDEMPVYHLTPSSCTYNVLLTGLCKNEHVLQALDLLQVVENNGVELGIRVYNSMIDGLCKSGRVETAWDVFTKLSSKGLKPTVVTYTVMIHGFCKTGRLKKADFLFLEMIENGCAPNVVTFNAFTRKGLDIRPKMVELVKKMVENKVKPDASTVSLMVDLLSKDEKYKQYLDMLLAVLEVG